MLNPKRLRGLSAAAASCGIYAYLPYIALYTGGTGIPIFAACAAAFYAMLSFGESGCINSIKVINNGPDSGKVLLNVSSSPLISYNIIASIKDIE